MLYNIVGSLKCPIEKRNSCDVFKRKLGKECWLVIKDVLNGFSGCKTNCKNCSWYLKDFKKLNYNNISKKVDIVLEKNNIV